MLFYFRELIKKSSILKEKNYLSVGEISKISNISTRTLRHYDNIGLLKPEKINDETGYRYYSKHQIFVISMIQDLKQMGFSLAEIKEAIKRDDLQKLTELYLAKDKEVIAEMNKLKSFHEKIKGRLQLFEKLKFLESNFQNFPDLYIEIKQIPKRTIAFKKKKSPFNFQTAALRIREVQNIVEKEKLDCTGNHLIIFHESYENPNNTQWENAAFLASDPPEKSEYIREIPAGVYATTLHWGAHKKSLKTYDYLLNWIKKHGYEVIGPVIKVYLKSLAFTRSQDELISEIQIPIRKL